MGFAKELHRTCYEDAMSIFKKEKSPYTGGFKGAKNPTPPGNERGRNFVIEIDSLVRIYLLSDGEVASNDIINFCIFVV